MKKDLKDMSIKQLKALRSKAWDAIKEKERGNVPESELERLRKELQWFIETLEDTQWTIEVPIKATYDVGLSCEADDFYINYDGDLHMDKYSHNWQDTDEIYKKNPHIKKEVKEIQKRYNKFLKDMKSVAKKCGATDDAMWDLVDKHSVWH